MSERNDSELTATALQRRQSDALTVVAQGSGALARHITELAQRHNVPVLQDFVLSENLSRVPPGARIPDHVFAALAAVLEFVQREDEMAANR
ncbi:MAG TPA: EscU/YscU/HrcU family type III secretion system export apparatus switch protein [Candidatus Acidoferrum sp.]|nr:EscU/YscU/HrcU family type III secretion system export apparatus switch protein [Candidatus Acidoferrum sp.]